MLSRIMDSRITFHLFFWGNVATGILNLIVGNWGSAAFAGVVAAFLFAVDRT